MFDPIFWLRMKKNTVGTNFYSLSKILQRQKDEDFQKEISV